MTGRGLAAVAVSAIAALSCAPALWSPASAQTRGGITVTATNFALSPAPDNKGNETTNVLFVDGQFDANGGIQPTFDWVSVSLSWRGPTPGPPVPGPFTVCGANPPSGPKASPCSGSHVDLAHHPLAPWSATPAQAFNGPYRVSATGQASDQFTGQQATGGTSPVDFSLVVPPPNVTGVTAAVDKNNRSTIVSWDRDTTTPDVQAYFIWRKGPGDKDFRVIAQTPQLNNGTRLLVVDFDTANKGGDYTYEIETHRNGATGDSNSFVPSDRSKSTSNTVTVPNPPPGATTTPTTAPHGNGAPPVLKGTPSGVNRNSGFSGSNFGSPSASPPTTENVTPDPGFVRGLPDAGGETPGGEGEGDNSAVAVTPGRHTTSNTRGYLIPVAGGAILFLGALHMRLLKKRLDEPVGLA